MCDRELGEHTWRAQVEKERKMREGFEVCVTFSSRSTILTHSDTLFGSLAGTRQSG